MFQFEWPRDRDGYEWVGAEPRSTSTILTGRRGWVIRPLGGSKEFYKPLEENPGLFRRFASLPIPADREAILEFTKLFGMLDASVVGLQLDTIEERIKRFYVVTSALDNMATRNAAYTFNDHFHPRFTVRMDPTTSPPQLSVHPSTLYGAMMFQVAQEIAGIVKFRKCKQCPEWFPLVGKNKKTTRKEFHADRCRVAWNRQQKRKEA